MSRPRCLRCGAGAEWIEGKVPDEPEREAHSLQRHCCASGPATPEKRSIESWVLEAARELAMDSAHIPCIAQIIQRHVPPPNGEVSGGRPASDAARDSGTASAQGRPLD